MTEPNPATHPLTPEQKFYLDGFVNGVDALRQRRGKPAIQPLVASLPVLNGSLPMSAAGTTVTVGSSPAAGNPNLEPIHFEAQNRTIAAGGKLTNEENAKRNKNPFAIWDEMLANAEAGKFPKGTDVFLYKFHGMFYVAPAQDSFMCRLRFPGGVITAAQMRGVAELAEKHGGGYTHITTRANLQIREIPPTEPIHIINGLLDLGIINKGSGADNIRNVTASPTAGIDPHEIIDTLPLARQMHHYILNHREMYGLPRKFNIAFDGAGKVSALADTNDIGFFAVRISEEHAKAAELPGAGVYFRMELGGITGHKDFSRDTGLLLTPAQVIPAAAAVVRAFSEHGDRTDRKKARLKYVLDRMGHDGFLKEVEKHLPFKPVRVPLEVADLRTAVDTTAHIGFHPQKQPGKVYAGVVTPVGKLTCEQMRGLAAIADEFGSSTIRLTVWQNLLISDIDEKHAAEVARRVEALGLTTKLSSVRAGLVACTGSAGCKFAGADTKKHAIAIAEHVESRLELDTPVNIHVTGCHHSCAQHYIGDIGCVATKVARGEETLDGYHVFIGGGYGEHRNIGREFQRDVVAEELPLLVEKLLATYLKHREPAESFQAFTVGHDIEPLRALVAATPIAPTTLNAELAA